MNTFFLQLNFRENLKEFRGNKYLFINIIIGNVCLCKVVLSEEI